MPIRDLRPDEIVIPSDLASGSNTPGMSVSPQMRDLSPDETVIPMGSQQPFMSAGDLGRAAMTIGVRGLTGLPDALADPLAPLRRLISPEMERIEQQGFHPGQAAGNAIFNATGVPEYQPTTGLGRTGMAATTGMVAGAPFGVGGAVIGGIGGGAGQATYEATGSDRLATAASMLPGGAISAAGLRAGSRMTPELNEAGVNPTFGQAMGGPLGRLEQGLSSIYFVGDIMKMGRAKATEQFNRGAIDNFALKPIGEQLDPSTPLGRPALNEMRTKIGNAYDSTIAQLGDTSLRTPEYATGLNKIMQNSQMLSSEHRKLFDQTYKKDVLERMDDNGALSGQNFKDLDTTLGQLGTQHLHSQTPADQRFGNVIMDLRDQVRQQVGRSNPDVAAQLQKVNDAYKYAERISLASTRMGTGLQGQSEPGVFTPSQLTSAVQQMDPSLRHHAFAQGNAVLQNYAESGRKLLGDTLPDSGTTYRALASLAAGGGGGKAAAAYGFLDPLTLAMLGVGAGTAGLAYSPAGRAAMNYFLRRPGQAAGVGYLSADEDQYRR